MSEPKNQSSAPPLVCPRCQYQRQANEQVPDWQCPSCQIVYAKYSPPVTPDETPFDQVPRPEFIIREELYPKTKGSPLPWLLLLLLLLAGGSYFIHDYFRWPDADKVTLFTSDSCGPTCAQARRWLQSKKVEFIERNVDAASEHLERWKRVGGREFPLTIFGEERIEQFNPTIYQIALTGHLDRINNRIDQTVILFTAAGSEDCRTVVELLRKRRIAFEEYDIREPENLEVYQELFGRQTPLIFVGNIRLDGYSHETLDLALRLVDLP